MTNFKIGAVALCTATAIFVFVGRAASGGQGGALVRLQSTTPGVAQDGHLNITGKGRMSAFQMTSGAAANRYLISDASGNAAWSPLNMSGVGAGGDLAGTYPSPTLAVAVTSLAKVSGGWLTANATGVSFGAVSPTSIGSGNFTVNDGSNSFGGMFVNTSGVGQPFYGFAHGGTSKGWMEMNQSGHWRLWVADRYVVTARPDGTVSVGTTSSNGKLDVRTLTEDYTVFAVNGTPSVFPFGNKAALVGTASALSAAGVLGYADHIGVYGHTEGDGALGVFGAAPNATSYGVFASGRLGASGAKSFRIDHPLDPANKYLMHYCSEGPEPLNIYRGTVTTDSKGYATVRLPDYFEAINIEPTFQLTVVDEGDDFVLAKVLGRPKGGEFTIRTSQPGCVVDWRVEAKRNDRWVQRYGVPVEVEKPKHELGRYQHPELYDAPASMGTQWVEK